MPLHKSRLPDKDEGMDPTTPPPTPVSDSEMTFDSDRAPHLSPEVKSLLDYLRNSPDFEASPMSHVVGNRFVRFFASIPSTTKAV
ncbi:hypothetical protein BG000_009068 [Podila horticola]|nr:hypothetical protein BG000_009068 [Podila horticola]